MAIRILVAALVLTTGAPAHAQRGKPIVAVYEMKDIASTGQAPAFTAMIETAITSTNKFRVMERKFGNLSIEQQSANSGTITTNTPGRRGSFEGADFLVYGTITTAAASRRTDAAGSIGRNLLKRVLRAGGPDVDCSRTVTTLALDIKIVDARTGESRFATNINQSAQSSSSCSGDTQIDTAALLRLAADKIAAGLVTTIFPIQVAAVQSDGTIVLNYGEGTVSPGALMAVFAKGERIYDPANGEDLGSEGAQIGTVRVTEVTARLAKAVVVSGLVKPPTIGSIVRPAPQIVAGRKR